MRQRPGREVLEQDRRLSCCHASCVAGLAMLADVVAALAASKPRVSREMTICLLPAT
jgi:hypothetical protein